MSTFGTIVRRGGARLPLIVVTALAGTGSSLALPSVLGHTVDAMVAGSTGGRWLLWAVALVTLSIVVSLINAYNGAVCVADVTAWLRQRLIGHLFSVDPRALRRFGSGDLVSRLTRSAADAATAGPRVVAAGTAVVPPVASLILLVLIDWWVAVAFLAGVGLVTLVLTRFTRRSSTVLRSYQETQGRIATRLTESLAGARTIAAAGTTEQEVRRVLEPLPQLHAHGTQAWRIMASTGSQAAVVGPLVQVAVLAVGGFALARGRISAGELFAASQYAKLGAGLGALTGVLNQLARARAGARRAVEVLTAPARSYGPYALPTGPGTLVLSGVTVRHDDQRVLDGVDLTIAGGAEIALVGPSGSGKSTLAAVATRLLDPDEGTVLLDGVPLPAVRHDVLRSAIGIAFERPVLLGRTVAEAISAGRDPRLVLPAATATRAHDFISRLPAGYNTALVDAPMSGGEAQRLGLARAWPAGRLLVLDDATSSLDMVTEMHISRALTECHGRSTRLVITHRAAVAARADAVVWMAAGRIRAVGTHEQLWENAEYRSVFQ